MRYKAHRIHPSRKPCIDALIKLGYTWLPPQPNQPARDKTGEAFEQIKQYKRDIPRLFYSNLPDTLLVSPFNDRLLRAFL